MPTSTNLEVVSCCFCSRYAVTGKIPRITYIYVGVSDCRGCGKSRRCSNLNRQRNRQLKSKNIFIDTYIEKRRQFLQRSIIYQHGSTRFHADRVTPGCILRNIVNWRKKSTRNSLVDLGDSSVTPF